MARRANCCRRSPRRHGGSAGTSGPRPTATGPRLVFFTSARVAQYAIGPPGPGQLLADRTFRSGGRKEMSGRNYGLVMRDGTLPLLAFIGGTNANTLHADMLSGKQQADP